MKLQKKKTLLGVLLVLSLLVLPFSGLSIKSKAAAMPKNITGFTFALKEQGRSFPAANGTLTNAKTLDIYDFEYTITYDGSPIPEKLQEVDSNGTTVLKDNDGNIYTIDGTVIEKVSKTVGKDQPVTAKLKYKDSENNEKEISSSNEVPVTITSSTHKVDATKISLILKDRKKTTFYAAMSDGLDSEDTLDADDLELKATFKVQCLNNSGVYESTTTEVTETIPLDSTDEYTIKTNINEIRKQVGEEQELWAELTINGTTIKSSDNEPKDNPIVNIIPAPSTMKLKAIAIKLKDTSKDKKFYADNGLMKTNELLSPSDFNLVLTYENGKTATKEVETTDDYKVATNINTIKKLVGKNQEVAAKLTYTGSDGKEVTIQTVDSATVTAEKKINPSTTLTATTAKVTILAPYAINGVITVTPQNFGANTTDNKTDKAAIQDALDLAGAGHTTLINFPSGNYYIGGNLYLHSNTILKLANDATIIRNSNIDQGVAAGTTNRLGVNKNMFKIAPYGESSADSTLKTGGYSNGVNILIEGGNFDGGNISAATSASNLFNLGHVNNITIRNANFKNCYGNHLIELVAAQNVEISECTFSGFRYVESEINDDDGTKSYADKEGDLAEAIQIDVAHKDSKSSWTSAYLTDNTPCNNINIHDNTFTDYPVAVGNHHYLDGHHHTNISVTGNKIIGTKTMNSGIKLFGCDNSVASGNTITNYSTGVKASASAGFNITGNNISKATYGVIETDASNGQITNNAISELKNQGIIVYGNGTVANTVSGNTITNSNINGILVHTSATATEVKSNKIKNCKSNGILVYSSANVSNVASNTIDTCSKSGIQIYNSAKVTNVKSNKISNCTGTGIAAYTSATVTNIKKNTINKCGQYGVYVYNKASVKTLSSNTIKNTGKNGIYVKNDKIKITCKSNKLTSVGKTALKIDSKFSKKKKQKYTFSPKVVSLNLAGGNMVTKASNLKKIKIKIGKKSYTKSTKAANYTFYFKKYKKSVSSVPVTFTDKNKNTVVRTVEIK
ncbi:MAG: right-handed parallel beta-helix repeat-containing protein [Lachnospiraceae bacterium]|nr:right-handed parallel beta-helix repeat-containing protein [Lachnospiraceae bacterium]